MEDAALLSGFLFFSKFALARSRRRLTGAVRGSANNWGSMSESRIGEGVLDVASIDSGVAGGELACAWERDVDILARGGMMILALTRARYPTVPAEDMGVVLKVIVGVCMPTSSC